MFLELTILKSLFNVLGDTWISIPNLEEFYMKEIYHHILTYSYHQGKFHYDKALSLYPVPYSHDSKLTI